MKSGVSVEIVKGFDGPFSESRSKANVLAYTWNDGIVSLTCDGSGSVVSFRSPYSGETVRVIHPKGVRVVVAGVSYLHFCNDVSIDREPLDRIS
jgi:hypothetical protein